MDIDSDTDSDMDSDMDIDAVTMISDQSKLKAFSKNVAGECSSQRNTLFPTLVESANFHF